MVGPEQRPQRCGRDGGIGGPRRPGEPERGGGHAETGTRQDGTSGDGGRNVRPADCGHGFSFASGGDVDAIKAAIKSICRIKWRLEIRTASRQRTRCGPLRPDFLVRRFPARRQGRDMRLPLRQGMVNQTGMHR
ncbi:hypothetical protein GCM10010176_089230 [Nonomuraea spiralis]|nr:hypothetical protein GCM10010176_089230 [Nonomuraea spiralis]